MQDLNQLGWRSGYVNPAAVRIDNAWILFIFRKHFPPLLAFSLALQCREPQGFMELSVALNIACLLTSVEEKQSEFVLGFVWVFSCGNVSVFTSKKQVVLTTFLLFWIRKDNYRELSKRRRRQISTFSILVLSVSVSLSNRTDRFF